ncbi:MAG: hypothetical protein IJY39_14270 [Clostridia bacterium]|nr:hypothetical protein [Clostridia bacterium]
MKIRTFRRFQIMASVVYLVAIVLTLLFLNLSYHNWKKLDTDPLLFAFGFLAVSLMYFPFLVSALSALQLHITHIQYGELYTVPMKALKATALVLLITCSVSNLIAITVDSGMLISTASTVAAALLIVTDTLVCAIKKRALPKD